MDRNLRLTVLYLALSYYLALWMFTAGWAIPIPILPLAYPIYRCGRQFRAGRVWYLGALISIGLMSIPLAIAQGSGLLACFLFFAVGNLHLAVKMNNLQATIMLAIGVLSPPLGFFFDLAGAAGIVGEGSGLLMLSEFTRARSRGRAGQQIFQQKCTRSPGWVPRDTCPRQQTRQLK